MEQPYWIRTQTKHFTDACKLGNFLEKEYKVEINIPYSVMEGERRLEAACYKPLPDDPYLLQMSEMIAKFVTNPSSLNLDILECLMSDQALKGNIPEGEYLLKFDD